MRRVADAAFPSSIRRLRNQKLGKRRPQPAPHSRLSPFFLFDGRNDDHRQKGLLARGFDERHFANYGGLPAEWRDRDRIARQLLRDANDHFHGDELLRGVPGFWKDHRGWRLWKERDYSAPRLLIPVRDGSGRISDRPEDA